MTTDFWVHDGNVFFPGPQAFCKKAVERVNSEKNILNKHNAELQCTAELII